jgi:hypothetical protein
VHTDFLPVFTVFSEFLQSTEGETRTTNELHTEAAVIDASGVTKDISKPEASVVDKLASRKKKDKGNEKAKPLS